MGDENFSINLKSLMGGYQIGNQDFKLNSSNENDFSIFNGTNSKDETKNNSEKFSLAQVNCTS